MLFRVVACCYLGRQAVGSTSERPDWAHLGRTIRRWRVAAGIKRQADLAASANLSAKTIGNYERGRVPESAPIIPDGYYAIAAHFGWTSDSIERILAGGSPEITEAAGRPPAGVVAVLTDQAFRLVDVARDTGAPSEMVLRARLAITDLVGWMQHSDRERRSDYGLAASRPHAVDGGIPADDAARISAELEKKA
jgi:DNA-binding XRE family transcriptional regulator